MPIAYLPQLTPYASVENRRWTAIGVTVPPAAAQPLVSIVLHSLDVRYHRLLCCIRDPSSALDCCAGDAVIRAGLEAVPVGPMIARGCVLRGTTTVVRRERPLSRQHWQRHTSPWPSTGCGGFLMATPDRRY